MSKSSSGSDEMTSEDVVTMGVERFFLLALNAFSREISSFLLWFQRVLDGIEELKCSSRTSSLGIRNGDPNDF